MNMVRIIAVQKQTKEKISKMKNGCQGVNHSNTKILFDELCSCYDILVNLTEHHMKTDDKFHM